MYDIAVVGGGLVGSSFALDLALQRPDLKIVIVERQAPDFTQNSTGLDSKIYAISPQNYHKLLELVPDFNSNNAGTIQQMSVYGDEQSLIELKASDGHADYLAKTIEYRQIHQAVWGRLEALENVKFELVTLAGINNGEENVQLLTEDKQLIGAKWVVAADGANSFVRRQLDFTMEEIPYFQSGVVANFSCEYAHDNIARQWFLGDSILAWLPLAGKQISIVWSCDNPEQIVTLSAEELCHTVAQAGNHSLGTLSLLTPPQAFPLKLNLVEKFYQNQVILIGDAAHTIHPLAGQGVNLGFGDAWELALLFARNSGQPLSNVDLARYNYQRLSAVRQMQMACHLLHRLFHNRLKVVNKLRNFGLGAVNTLAPLKKLLVASMTKY